MANGKSCSVERKRTRCGKQKRKRKDGKVLRKKTI